MDWFGLALLGVALLLMVTSGVPTYAVLLGTCSAGAAVALAFGGVDQALLGGVGARVLGLLEHDLLQALALYALVGALLNRLQLVGSLMDGLTRALRSPMPHAGPQLAGMTLGALLAPMNGSVGASLLALSQATAARWAAAGIDGSRRAVLLAVASTMGVIVPPSLVLLLLGDAMLRAHTEGLNLARSLSLPLAQADIRVVNTQDVLQAALVPGALLLAGWLAWTAFSARRAPATAAIGRWTAAEAWALAIVPAAIALLLAAVAAGWVRAVEAAASAGVALLAWGLASRRLTPTVLRAVLDDALALTGALFALLVAATSFSLLLRALGTDRLVGAAMLALQGSPMLATLAVLGLLLASSFVLDAFELIFLVVPIVMPPLLAQVADAAWVAALTLLVLQAGFLLPPFGYAVLLARGATQPQPRLGELARGLAPFLLWTGAVAAIVLAWPQTTHWLRTAPSGVAQGPQLSPQDLENTLREMSSRPPK